MRQSGGSRRDGRRRARGRPRRRAGVRVLRLCTYLTPSVPRSLFAYLAGYLGERLGVETALQIETRHSGPPRGEPDPFSQGEVDVGFLCAPPYIWLREREDPPVELVPFGLVFDDPRGGGRPVYFSDIVVRADHPARSFADLVGARWGFNDRESLSGYYSVLQTAVEHGAGASFLGRLRDMGSHLASLRALRRGVIDAAAIDSTVLALRWRQDHALRTELRIVHGLGPWPIQPIVIRRSLPVRFKAALVSAVGALGDTPAQRRALRRWLVSGVAPMTDADFDVERAALARAEALDGFPGSAPPAPPERRGRGHALPPGPGGLPRPAPHASVVPASSDRVDGALRARPGRTSARS
jgi:phosphonate transport system substrate-binding protein